MKDIPMEKQEKGMNAILDEAMEPGVVPRDADAPAEVKAFLARIDRYRHRCQGYDDRRDAYLYCAAFCPEENMPVGAALEPVIPAPEFGLDANAVVTLNHYDALVLNSKNMLNLDVDFADRRFNKWGVANIHQLLGYLHDLAALEARMEPVFKWSEQTWKVYTTTNGARVIMTSAPFPLNHLWRRDSFRQLCAFLGADPIYSHICLEQQCYRARLSPKSGWLPGEFLGWPVCFPAITLWPPGYVHPDLRAQLIMHDQVSRYPQRAYEWDEKEVDGEPACERRMDKASEDTL
jgi:hypothetical protein